MDFLRSLAVTVRSLSREKTFALAFVLTLGLGIGANTAIFSLVYGVLLRPLPYPDSDRIVHLEQAAKRHGMENINFSFPEVADYREQVASLDQIVEFGDWTFNVLGRGEPHRAVAGLVTANFFEVLGMRPVLGRTLQAEDRVQGAPPVAVLTHEYWLRVFGADPGVLGQSLDLTSKVATIVGVLEPGAHYATRRRQDFYANYTTNDHYSSATMEDDRKHRMTDVFARLAPGATVEEAAVELNHALRTFHTDHPDDYPEAMGLEIVVTPWKDELVARARPTLILLLGAAAFVLVIACANVANLTLARALRRERELAVRSALGAGGGRLRAQLFLESLVLALFGAGLGLVLAYGLLDALRAYTSRFTSRTGEIAIDSGVLAFTLLVAVLTAVAFSLVPGLVPARRLGAALAAGAARATASGARRFLQRALVTSQLAVSFVLLVGAGLLVRTLWNLHAVDPGYELDQVLSVEAPKGFGVAPSEEMRRFSQGAVSNIMSIPTVDAVALTATAPLSGGERFPIQLHVEGVAEDDQTTRVPALFETVTADYFRALGVELVSGRAFSEGDDPQAPKVAILNESAARHYFGDADPIGRRLTYSFGGGFVFDDSWLTLVGVAADARVTSVDRGGQHVLYLPEAQSFPAQTVLVRTQGDPRPVTPQVVETLRALDPERPLEHVFTLAELRDESLAPQRLNAVLFAIFAGLALAIAAVGVAAVLAFTVSARRRELGIRAALGAAPARLLRLVLRDGGSMAVLGLALGAVGGVVLTRFLQGLLYEVEPLDALTFLAVGAILLVVALGAALVPARWATKTAPVEVLRSE
ncbi:MAG TPA: ABC transporter permease [Thermoanaerobaculia bacterium]|nr:ABC transporter permease [Thermoanaerobaculia bacterium]